MKALGPLTALVNNASVFENDNIATMTRESWDKHMEANLRAPLVLSQGFAQQLPEGAEGAIVNLLDQRIFKPTPQFLSYGVSRAGLHWLTTVLAQALAPRVRVNAVAPGPTIRNQRQSEAHFRRQTGIDAARPRRIARKTSQAPCDTSLKRARYRPDHRRGRRAASDLENRRRERHRIRRCRFSSAIWN